MDDSAKKQSNGDPTTTFERPAPPVADAIEDASTDDDAAKALVSNAFIGGATPFAGTLVDKEPVVDVLTEEEAAKTALEGKAQRARP